MQIMFAKVTIILWILLIVVMLPAYFIRKKKNPNDENNTIKKLIIKSFVVSFVFVLLFYIGIIAMHFDELTQTVHK